MKKKKDRYFNDPVHGTFQFPFDIAHALIDHPYMQRLRRITQCGLSHYVFPGANHTRFHHTLGVAYLSLKVTDELIKKGVTITQEEQQATCLAALLHDIGHGPYSHALERRIINLHHEELSKAIAQKLNKEFNGKLSLAIDILYNNYEKKFLSEIISGQLDVDRLDYLTRDSFYTGVNEGNIGNERIIKTFNVFQNHLVVEKKAYQSVEKFLVARHHMYWQVYIHKTVLAIQQMLISITERIDFLLRQDVFFDIPVDLKMLLLNKKINIDDEGVLEAYLQQDDFTFMHVVKMGKNHPDYILSYLCTCLLDRKIFTLDWINTEKNEYLKAQKLLEVQNNLKVSDDESNFLVRTGTETSSTYLLDKEIQILTSDCEITPLSELSQVFFREQKISKSFICYPKLSRTW